MSRVQYDAKNHAELEADIAKITNDLDQLITQLNKLKGTMGQELEGETSAAMNQALERLISKCNKGKTNWASAQMNAKKIGEVLLATDKSMSVTIAKRT